MSIKTHGVYDRELEKGMMYNGIKRPDEWPPRDVDACNPEPPRIPYLYSADEGGTRPGVIDVTVGRQLFVDDFLIEKTDMSIAYHQPKKYEGSPVMSPETHDELLKDYGVGLSAGGLWYDMEDNKYKLWYDIAFNWGLGYAESEDGIHWKRYECNGGTIMDNTVKDGTCSVFIDYAADKSEKYKMFMQSFLNEKARTDADRVLQFRDGYTKKDTPPASFEDHFYASTLYVSADGIHWERRVGMSEGIAGDASSAYYDPLAKKWVNSIRSYAPTVHKSADEEPKNGRVRYYAEHDDFDGLLHWRGEEAVLWQKRDKLDEKEPGLGYMPQMYNFNAVAYESIMYGGWQIWRGPENGEVVRTGNPKLTEIMASFSRDGFHYDRPSRVPFIPAARQDGAWDKGYVFAPPASMIVYEDEIRFYYSAFSGYKGEVKDGHGCQQIGFATLRRDGFASLDGKGELLTRPLTVHKDVKYLFVNIDLPKDALRAEVLDENGKSMEGFALEDCIPTGGNSTCAKITWRSGKTLEDIKDKTFRIRLSVKESGSVYAFWLSNKENGVSGGAYGAGYVGNKN